MPKYSQRNCDFLSGFIRDIEDGSVKQKIQVSDNYYLKFALENLMDSYTEQVERIERLKDRLDAK